MLRRVGRSAHVGTAPIMNRPGKLLTLIALVRIVRASAYLCLGRPIRSTKAGADDVTAEVGPPNKRMQLTKPAQATELRS